MGEHWESLLNASSFSPHLSLHLSSQDLQLEEAQMAEAWSHRRCAVIAGVSQEVLLGLIRFDCNMLQLKVYDARIEVYSHPWKQPCWPC